MALRAISRVGPSVSVALLVAMGLTGCATLRSRPGLVDVRRNNTYGVSWVRLGYMRVLTQGPFGLGFELNLAALGVATVNDVARAEERRVDPRYVTFMVSRLRSGMKDKELFSDCHDLRISVDGRELNVGETHYSSTVFSGPERITVEIPTEDMRSLARAVAVEIVVCDDPLQLLPEHVVALRRFARRLGDFPLHLTPEAALHASGPKGP